MARSIVNRLRAQPRHGAFHVVPLGSCSDLAPFFAALSERPGRCWLDGATEHADGEWSFVASDPVERVCVPQADPAPLRALDALGSGVNREIDNPRATLGPAPEVVPRWIGYIAYDAHFGAARARLARLANRPVLSFARYDALVALHHPRRLAYLVGDDAQSCARLRQRLGALPRRVSPPTIGPLVATPPEHHHAAIARALRYIRQGEIYQVNLARCWEASYEGAASPLWTGLRAASPVPFGFYYEDLAPNPSAPRIVMARTMERFLRFHSASRELLTRPIKGTRARPSHEEPSAALAMQVDPKEHAEHAMIVDLMRNDLGRVAEFGSVRVIDPFAIEPYAGLSHMVSSVRCLVRSEFGLRAIVEATFPPGSVTGAPKLRAIEAIEELEAAPRDAYTGAVGFIDRRGGLSLAVAIRTAIIDEQRLRYFAGGGIVEASDPAREVAETDLKAKVLFDALHSRSVLG